MLNKITVLMIVSFWISSPCYGRPIEYWRCHFPSGSGTWKVAGRELIGPLDDLKPVSIHYPVVTNDNGVAIAVTNLDHNRRFQLVTLDKNKRILKLRSMGLEDDFGEHESETAHCERAKSFSDTTRK